MLTSVAPLVGAQLAVRTAAQVLPTGGQVVSGQASVGQSGAQMTVDQASQVAILHWQDFAIGSGAKVQFNQPDASAVTLIRIVGGNASEISGQLSANGQVWLVNPNGVVFGKDSQVNMGGLAASTLDITSIDFDAGKPVFTRSAARGGITNGGNITVADGGTLALLAVTVKNDGILSAQSGNVVLAGGNEVTLQAGVDGRLQVAVDPATVHTLIENRQLIKADGGQVVMTSSTADTLSASVVSNTGTVQARTLAVKEGRILLLGDMRHGEVVHSGLIDASAPDGSNGGFVETRAARVTLQAGRKVTTCAASGHAGTWLIKPGDYTIAPVGGDISGAQLSGDLDEGNVTIAMVSQGIAGGKGDIHFNDDVTWTANTLTLNAGRNIKVNGVMTAEGTAGLEMNYGATPKPTRQPLQAAAFAWHG
ncbi:filamentous hemagglutinin N-terminal domain-containing protein [Comamonas endophytica]|uniref:two-partner secretion domain-containing protein n=1 Tax=Comamonas endophytica TaxID=2949090 RepID=UPI003611A6FE